MPVIAYKFLDDGRSPFTGWRWDLPASAGPGKWLSVEGPLDLCRNGVHACTVTQLPLWMGPQLWTIEVDGEVLETPFALIASKARLLGQVSTWDAPTKQLFAEDCATRAQARTGGDGRYTALLQLIQSMIGRSAASAGYWSAVLAGEMATGQRSGPLFDEAFRAERTEQASWMAGTLGLV